MPAKARPVRARARAGEPARGALGHEAQGDVGVGSVPKGGVAVAPPEG